jgi:hypothetical protein
MKYFENFPRTLYTFDKNTINPQSVTNIFARTAFLRDIKENVNLSYEYLIRDEDTPDIIAHKAYGDAYRSWIILLFNVIINPNYDWPLKSSTLDAYISKKYNMSILEAQSTIHHYEREVTITSTYGGIELGETIEKSIISEFEVNPTTNALTPNSLPDLTSGPLVIKTEVSDYSSYTLTTVTRNKAISIYEHEFEENELKRRIRILDPVFVPRVENEFRELMLNG